MKSMFDNDRNEVYTNDSRLLDEEASHVIKLLFRKFMDKGYNTRDISHVILLATMTTESEIVLTKMHDARKGKENYQ